MKQAFPAVALLALLLGLFVEQRLWAGQGMEQTAEEKRANCEHCGRPAILIYTNGAGWVCEACDLENMTAEKIT